MKNNLKPQTTFFNIDYLNLDIKYIQNKVYVDNVVFLNFINDSHYQNLITNIENYKNIYI